ncbi:MAG: hypothetical protein BWX86_00856 [Verrucomicrobia bacterium ADurb.Bin122]|nr:MAG: hypothetical protein BWX86_00856 [Verrucomicrobia bacterium ADurb.Bin122]
MGGFGTGLGFFAEGVVAIGPAGDGERLVDAGGDQSGGEGGGVLVGPVATAGIVELAPPQAFLLVDDLEKDLSGALVDPVGKPATAVGLAVSAAFGYSFGYCRVDGGSQEDPFHEVLSRRGDGEIIVFSSG